MESILLDRFGDACIPEGYTLIDSEVAFLSQVTAEGKWLVRGSRLCQWAEAFFAGRGIRVEEVFSPCAELQQAVPDLTDEQAVDLLTRLGAHFDDLQRPLTAQTIAAALYPGYLWRAQPSPSHAAEWLLWLDQLDGVGQTDQHLLRVIAEQWLYQSSEELKRVYEVMEPNQAREMLSCWLGIDVKMPFLELEEFPAEVQVPPRWRDRASRAWRLPLIQTHGAFTESLLERPLPPALREIVAQEAVDYFTNNPEHLTAAYLDKLVPVISANQWRQLRRLLPPPEPSPVPNTPQDVLEWFTQQYLPFREWQELTNDQQALHHVLVLAQCFAEWYLAFYPRALVSSNDSAFLSFLKTGALRQTKTRFVTLLVVLDGLHQTDARHLLQALQGKAKRLTVRQAGLAFTAIPTVTQFAKEALMKGVLPKDSAEVPLLGEDVSERQSPMERLQAGQPGDIFIWRIQEPDRTYHARNSYDTLENEVEGQLNTVASKIADVTNQLSDKIALRVILTSDHGRLLGTSPRCVPVPAGMQTHGRAAWGRAWQDFSTSGYVLDGNTAYLYGERFGLTEDIAIILDESAFLTSDGKQGAERYPHGGLFPEEVLVPWIELERDVVPTQEVGTGIQVRITGKGRAGQPGVLDIEIANANEIPLVLSSVRLSLGEKRRLESFDLENEIPALKEHHEQVELKLWPSKDEARRASASVVVRWPGGEYVEVSATIDIESEELYWRDASLLEDLDL
ncbi:MAG: hypothetical protein M5U05_19475 [Anaerolineales bacterium]|nr:hypothetical protein [Anaerolineales bacterium]